MWAYYVVGTQQGVRPVCPAAPTPGYTQQLSAVEYISVEMHYPTEN